MPEFIKETYNKLIYFIKSLFSVDGVISSIRYLSIMTVTVIISTWSYLSVKNNTVLDIPVGVLTVFIAALLGKVASKKLEVDNSNIPVDSNIPSNIPQ